MKFEPTVFVVDDDPAVRKAMGLLMKSVGLNAETSPSAREFLDGYDPARPGCLVLDIRMAGMSGLELQEKLREQQITLPVIIITGHGDVPTAVRAIQAGALGFIEKPFRDQVLLDHINRAIEQDATRRRDQARRTHVESRIARLTPREREVVDLLVAGKSSKQIGFELGISVTTVNLHRSHAMSKLQVDSVVDLVRMAGPRDARLEDPAS